MLGCALGLAWAAVPVLRAVDVTLMWRPVNGTREVVVDDSGFLRVGQNELSMTRLAAVVSQVAFVRADGTFAQLDGQFGALDSGAKRSGFRLRGVPPGRYIGLQFLVGLQPQTNHADPGAWPAGHPLNPLVNGLHWGWQGGYVFLALEGHYRDGDATRGWSFHVGTDDRLMLVQVPHPLVIEADATITLDLDLARMLEGVVLSPKNGNDSTHSAKGDALAERLAANVGRAFAIRSVDAATRDRVDTAQDGHNRPRPATPLPFDVPAGWPQPTLPADNPLTSEGVALGRQLFADRRLSGNGTQACISCHATDRAFSDDVAFSRGADGALGRRNAMPLANLAWAPTYAWDGSQLHVRDQALAAMQNPIEMHANAGEVAKTLARDRELTAAFAAAFGTPEVTAGRIGLALEQYLLTIVSADAKFDRAIRGMAELNEEEKEGFALFVTEYDPARGRRGADCFHCHGGALFTDFAFKSNGLDLVSRDAGRSALSGRVTDAGKFKTPSLRNVAVTAPYMHDGRFATLEAVIAHYDHGVKRAASLDPNLAKHPDAGLQLTPAEQKALVAFLRTLTDAKFEAAKPGIMAAAP
jgi:cytochrome c peroxidase